MDAFESRISARQSTGDLPTFRDRVVADADNQHTMTAFGISVSDPGVGNVVILDGNQEKLSVTLNLARAKNSRIVIGKGAAFTSVMTIVGNNALMCLGGMGASQGHSNVKINVDGNDALIHLGSGFTSVGSHIILSGPSRSITFGPDCMLSWGITIHNYDHHTIFDLDTGSELNPAGDIRIGRHVWLGQDVLFAGGASIGDGSIVGARSLVTGDVPRCCLAVGSPARVIRSNVSWTRNRYGHKQAIEVVQLQLRGEELQAAANPSANTEH